MKDKQREVFTNLVQKELPDLLLCSKRDKARFIKFWDSKLIGTFAYNGKQAYDTVTKLIYDVVEGRNDFPMQVILSGRQPSLHKYAIRAYLPKIVLENTVNVHTLVCSGYNADFDGDQMWLQALMSEEAKEEALRLLSPAVDYINPKDSAQYALLNSDDAYTDKKTGFRMYQGRYCIAVGSGYTQKVGSKIDLVMEDGSIIQCVSNW